MVLAFGSINLSSSSSSDEGAFDAGGIADDARGAALAGQDAVLATTNFYDCKSLWMWQHVHAFAR